MITDIRITPGTIVAWVLIAFALVWGSSLAQDIYIYAQADPDPTARLWFIDLDVEQSLYTGMSVVLIASCSFLLLIIGSYARLNRERYAFCWILLSVAFVMIAADELLSFHEKLSGILSSLFNYTTAFSVLAIGLLSMTALCFLPFLKSQPTNIARGMMAAGFIFVLGAAGMEILAGRYLAEGEMENMSYRLLVTVEEGLEGLGMILFMWTLLIKLNGKTFRIEAPKLQSLPAHQPAAKQPHDVTERTAP